MVLRDVCVCVVSESFSAACLSVLGVRAVCVGSEGSLQLLGSEWSIPMGV